MNYVDVQCVGSFFFYPDFYKSPSRERFVIICNLFIYLFIFPDDVAKFQVRGALLLKPGREPGVSLSQNPLSDEDRTKLKVNHVNHWFSDVFYIFPRWPSDGEISPVSNKYLVGFFFVCLFFGCRGGTSTCRYLQCTLQSPILTLTHAFC